MDRLNEIKDYIKPLTYRWMREKVKKCKIQPELQLLRQAEQALLEASERQKQDPEARLCYLCLFHLHSSIISGSWQYKIWAAGERLYFEPPLSEKIWNPEHLYSDVPDLRAAAEKEMKQYFVRLLPFETEFAVRTILNEYQKLADVYWRQATETLISGEIFRSLYKSRDWKILSGGYMGELKVFDFCGNRAR